MKIIKRGKLADEVPFRGTCHNCKSVIEAYRCELFIEYDHKEHGEFGRATCPVCRRDMIFYPKGR